jgi:hypothetical protein
MTAVPGRGPFGRPAMPIDMAALSYHWSVLKIVRLIFFFSGRARVLSDLARESDFLALADPGVVFFAILITRFIPTSMQHLSRCGVVVTGGLEDRTSCRDSTIIHGFSRGCRKAATRAVVPAVS